ncbi:MAG: hypothetical protein JWO38_6445 [Gemmataceae bacterium]|nr:hypothetical protein [Gemmataceae bacterium]
MSRQILVEDHEQALFESLTENTTLGTPDGRVLGHLTPTHLMPRELLESFDLDSRPPQDRDDDCPPPRIIDVPPKGS